MKIKGTVRIRKTKLGTFGVFTSLDLAKFGGKDVVMDVQEAITKTENETVTEKVK